MSLLDRAKITKNILCACAFKTESGLEKGERGEDRGKEKQKQTAVLNIRHSFSEQYIEFVISEKSTLTPCNAHNIPWIVNGLK